jgi:hypothetical protein
MISEGCLPTGQVSDLILGSSKPRPWSLANPRAVDGRLTSTATRNLVATDVGRPATRNRVATDVGRPATPNHVVADVSRQVGRSKTCPTPGHGYAAIFPKCSPGKAAHDPWTFCSPGRKRPDDGPVVEYPGHLHPVYRAPPTPLERSVAGIQGRSGCSPRPRVPGRS